MDLRNRDSFETTIMELNAVPADALRDLAQRLHALAQEDRQIDQNAVSESTLLMEAEALARMRHVGRQQGTLRIHAFSSINSDKSFSLRVSSDEVCFSNFVSRVDLKLPTGETVVWNRQSCEEGTEGITVERPFSGSGNVEIAIHVTYENCLYSVPAVLGGGHMSFVNLFKTICGYIKDRNLSSNDDPSYFTPDSVLHDLLYPNHIKQHPVSFASLLEAVRSHFKAPGPFTFSHAIGGQEQIFDLRVQLPDLVENATSVAIEEAERKLAHKLGEIDREIGQLTSGLEGTAKNARFLDKVAANPVEFFQQILETPTGTPPKIESAGLVDYMQLTTCHEFYKQPWAVAAATYVTNQQKRDSQ